MDLKRSVSKAITNKSLSVYKQIGNCLDDWEIKIDKKFSEWLKKIQVDLGISIPPTLNTEGNQKTPRKRTKLEMRHEIVIKVIDELKKEDPLFDPLRFERGMKREIFNRCKIKHSSLFTVTYDSFHTEYWKSDLRKQVLTIKDEEKFKS